MSSTYELQLILKGGIFFGSERVIKREVVPVPLTLRKRLGPPDNNDMSGPGD